MSLQATTWQTVGPYFRIGLEHLDSVGMASPDAHGEHVTIEGRVLDGNGKPVPDAVVEIWQADAKGEYSENVRLSRFRAHSNRCQRGASPFQRSNQARCQDRAEGCRPRIWPCG